MLNESNKMSQRTTTKSSVLLRRSDTRHM